MGNDPRSRFVSCSPGGACRPRLPGRFTVVEPQHSAWSCRVGRGRVPTVRVSREFGVTSSITLAAVGPRTPRRGDVWSVQFDERRRVVLLTGERGATFRSIQLVDRADQDISGVAIEVSLGIEESLPFEEVARFAFSRPGFTPCTWLANLGREDLIEWIGELSEVKMEEIDDALKAAGLDPITLPPGVADHSV